MRFWDTSALAPLVIEYATSRACRALYRADPAIAVWSLTRTELVSVAQRLRREGVLDDDGTVMALARIDIVIARATEVTSVEAVRDRAERALGVHALRAADSLQLGAALVLVGDRPKNRPFVVEDVRLAQAARREGFQVICPKA
jgi:uncharacterized protein